MVDCGTLFPVRPLDLTFLFVDERVSVRQRDSIFQIRAECQNGQRLDNRGRFWGTHGPERLRPCVGPSFQLRRRVSTRVPWGPVRAYYHLEKE
jgi:hypothetical protein